MLGYLIKVVSLLALAITWFVIENTFFGWNPMPMTSAELIGDGVGFVLFGLAINAS